MGSLADTASAITVFHLPTKESKTFVYRFGLQQQKEIAVFC
jgi:hypothetical protein